MKIPLAFAILAAPMVHAAPVMPTDLDTLDLGAFVEGPVGVTVDSSFLATPSGPSIGDFSGGAACPSGFVVCDPMTNPAGTVYTFVQSVVPGANVVANDPPFADPATSDPGIVTSYVLDFAPAGFTGVAGYGFGDALAAGLSFDIDQADDGRLSFASVGADWIAGLQVDFFFQTTQPPSGPGGNYVLNGALSGTAAGPLPAPVTPIPLPAGALLLFGGLAGLGALRRRA